MAITTTQAQGLVLALFGASAGGHLTGLAAASDMNSLAGDLSTSAGLILGKDLSSNTAFRDHITANLKLTGDALTAANAWLDGQLTAGFARGEIVATAVDFLSTLTDETSPFYASAQAFQTTVEAAVAWSTGDGAAVFGVTALRANQGNVEVVAGSSFVLTTASDIINATEGNDSITATTSTVNSGDVIIGGGGTDTLTVTATAATGPFGSVSGVESVVVNMRTFSAVAFDADNIVGGGTITVNNTQAGGTTDATVNNAETGATIVAGSGVTGTLTIEADGAVTVNGGSAVTGVTVDFNGVTAASTVTANAAGTLTGSDVVSVTLSSTSATAFNAEGTTGASDTLTVSGKNAATTGATIALNTNSDGTNTDQIENLVLSGNGGAATYVLNASDAIEQVTFTGDQNVQLRADAADITTETVLDTTAAGTATLRVTTLTSATSLVNVASTVQVEIDEDDMGADRAVTLADNAKVKFITSVNGGDTLTMSSAATGSETLNLAFKSSFADILNVDDYETINLVVNDEVATTGTVTIADLNASNVSAGVVNVTGADNLTLTGADTKFLNAQAFTGKLTATVASDLLKITGGSGNDRIYAADAAFVLDGGAGTDTLDIVTGALDLSDNTVTLSNFEVIAIDSGAGASNDTLTMTSTQITDQSWAVTGTDNGGANDTLAVTMAGSGSLNLGNLVVDSANVSVTINLANTAGVTHDITGSNADDTISNAGGGAITVNGGSGADTLTTGTGADTITGGEGADTIDAGTNADTILLTETTRAVDTVTIDAGDSTELLMDSITGFATHASAGDLLNLPDTTVATSIAATDVSSVTSQTSDTVTASTSAAGIMTIAGADAANIDTLAEYIDAAEILLATLIVDDADAEYGTLAFQFNGDTYVVHGSDAVTEATYATNVVVKLVGLTGITGVSTTAAANVIDIS